MLTATPKVASDYCQSWSSQSGRGLSRKPQKMTLTELEGLKRCLSERGVIEAENPVLLMF
jgi:hypothetical protein